MEMRALDIWLRTLCFYTSVAFFHNDSSIYPQMLIVNVMCGSLEDVLFPIGKCNTIFIRTLRGHYHINAIVCIPVAGN